MGASSTSSTQRSSIHKRTQLNYANEYERGLAVNVTELRTSMSKRSKWLFDVILIGLLSISVSMFGEPMPQNLAAQTQTPASDDAQRSQQTNSNSSDGNLTSTTQSNTTSSAQTNQQAPNQPSPPRTPRIRANRRRRREDCSCRGSSRVAIGWRCDRSSKATE